MNKKKKSFMIIFLLLTLVFITFSSVDAQTELSDEIRNTLTMYKANNIDDSNISSLYFLNEITSFYEKNSFKANWIKNDKFNESAIQLKEVLLNVEDEGLDPKIYRVQFLEKFFSKETLSLKEKAIADIFLTNSFYLLAVHFSNGVIDPENLEEEWVSPKKNINLDDFIKESIEQQKVKSSLYSLFPQHEKYYKLRAKLKFLRKIKRDGGWIKIDTSINLRFGMTGENIRKLKLRLKQSGDFSGEINEKYDDNLKKSIINFQKRHGLKQDGIVGPNTFKALNRDIEDLIKILEINMERLRWLPKTFGENYILTNIADLTLQVYENKQKAIEMNVIVGREERSTPVFSAKVSYLVLNPYWNVPKTIAVEDKLPLIKKDINYLKENNFTVVQYINGKFVEQNYKEINWDRLNENNFNYLLRQKPGSNNALGKVKFMFPNKYSVYLHDTPNKELFTQDERDLSSGCIRLEEPFKLLEYILRKNNKWDLKKVNTILETNKETAIILENKLPIHIVYLTAWVDNENRLQIRNDIYGRDARLISAFF